MLVLWSNAPQQKTLASVNHATRQCPDLKIQVVPSTEGIPNPVGMTALLCMGAEPLSVLAAHKVVPKNRTMTSLRAQFLPLPNTKAKALVTYSPGIADLDYGHFVDLQCDASSIVRYAMTGDTKPKYGQYTYVPDLSKFRRGVEIQAAQTGKPVPVALDLETIGLDPYALPTKDHPGAYIVCLQVTYKPGYSDLVYFSSMAQEVNWMRNLDTLADLSWLLSSPQVRIRGANLKFDLHWLFVRAGLECTNFNFDTTLVGSLLDENRSNGLDVHAKVYAPSLGGYSDHFDRTVDKSRMDLVPKEDMRLYAGGDTDACYQVADAQRTDLLKDERLTSFYVNILHPAARAFEKLERGGILIDQNAYKELRADLLIEISRVLTDAKKVLGGRIVAKHFDPTKPGGLNLSKASMITDFMFSPMGLNLKPKMVTEKTGAPSTALDHILMYDDVPEAKAFIALYKDYASATKTLSTYVDGFLEHLRSDSRFHPGYFFHAGSRDLGEGGTVSGRLSCKAPAFQTLPKHTKWAKRLRACYTAPPGYVLSEMDLSQGELRVVACIADETTMIKAYQEGLDLHCVTGAKLAGITYQELMALKDTDPDKFDAIRQPAKPCIAEGQLVMTDLGWVPIEKVTPAHLVWDGIAWVSQEGAIYKGVKFVMTYRGLTATPDHFVYTPVGVMPLYMAEIYGLPLSSSVGKNNCDIGFFYGKIENVSYLRGRTNETAERLVRKARGYGFRDYNLVARDTVPGRVFQARCALAAAVDYLRELFDLQSIANILG